jgi:hypothetical protein
VGGTKALTTVRTKKRMTALIVVFVVVTVNLVCADRSRRLVSTF